MGNLAHIYSGLTKGPKSKPIEVSDLSKELLEAYIENSNKHYEKIEKQRQMQSKMGGSSIGGSVGSRMTIYERSRRQSVLERCRSSGSSNRTRSSGSRSSNSNTTNRQAWNRTGTSGRGSNYLSSSSSGSFVLDADRVPRRPMPFSEGSDVIYMDPPRSDEDEEEMTRNNRHPSGRTRFATVYRAKNPRMISSTFRNATFDESLNSHVDGKKRTMQRSKSHDIDHGAEKRFTSPSVERALHQKAEDLLGVTMSKKCWIYDKMLTANIAPN